MLKQELPIGTVLTLAGGYGSHCQRHDTLSPGKQETLLARLPGGEFSGFRHHAATKA